MYIRMTSGREPGRVLDMRDEEAHAMLGDGRAIKVDFDDPRALETKTEFDPRDQQAQVLPPLEIKTAPGGEPELLASGGSAAPEDALTGAPRVAGHKKRSAR